jgi:orotate phosphoribosyltransferase
MMRKLVAGRRKRVAGSLADPALVRAVPAMNPHATIRHNPAPGYRLPVPMPDHRSRFLALALRTQALRFGEFTLKSGRVSPYFFNAGRFDSGALLAELAACYADAVDAAGVAFDLVFGPAYKGIPLATALACEYARRGRELPLAFNRKETKAHGEGGTLIGAPLAGKRVLVVDDVITAGTAIREALGLIRAAGGVPAGIVIALDREERVHDECMDAESRRSAAQVVAAEQGIPVIAVATLADLLAFAGESAELVGHRDALRAYRARYGSRSAN